MDKPASLLIYQCDFEDCEPDHQYGPALRDHYLLHCVLDGEGVYYICNQEYHLHRGQGFLIPPGVLTTYRASHSNPWSYCWVGFHGSDAGEIVRKCGMSLSQPIVDFAEVEEMKEAVRRIQKNLDEGVGHFEQLSGLYAFFSLMEKDKGYEERRNMYNVATEVIDYINRNYSYGITIEQMAHHLGMSRSQMFRQFKKEMGMSPQEYLLKFRLERSKELLQKEKLTVTEAMLSAGFSDLSNFSRQFKREYGYSPRVYQAKGL